MQRITCLFAAVVAIGGTNRVWASDLTGIYALIEDVTHESAGTPDETVRVRGVFSVAEGLRDYKPPVHGYMYFRLHPGHEEMCRREWADLKRVAGTGQLIAFSVRPRPEQGFDVRLGHVRRLNEEPAKPDEFPKYNVDFGVQKVRISENYLPHRRLAYFAAPSSPTDGTAVETGRVELVCRNVVARDENVEYHFEITDSKGGVEPSGAVEPGEKVTNWTPKTNIKPGETYTWRVWTVTPRKDPQTGKSEARKGPVATAQFTGKK